MTTATRRLWLVVLVVLAWPGSAAAQRELHWDVLSVAAHLNADGSLQVTEEQAMVFTGDWNGGERLFNIRPRQALAFDGMSRWTGTAWRAMRDGSLGVVDDYAFVDRQTLRWRSRDTSGPPFNRTPIRYQLRYTLSGILLKHGDQYTLDHDFAFKDRDGAISRFELRLTLDPAWHADGVRDSYSDSNLPPGRSFVLTIPMRYVGTGTPSVFDQSRPPMVRHALTALVGLSLATGLWVLLSELMKGRFARVNVNVVDQTWLREHILKYPAELVSAAWDDSIGQAEVVTLLARLTAEKKLEATPTGSGPHAGMKLRLLVSRDTFSGYARTLIDKLFFDARTTTSTDDVKSHYKSSGFNPVDAIRADVAAALKSTFPFTKASHLPGWATALLLVGGLAVAIRAWWLGELPGLAVCLLFLGSLVLAGLASIPGVMFRARMHWGLGHALACLLAPAALVGGLGYVLWNWVGTDAIELSTLTLISVTALGLGAAVSATNALRSRQQRDGIAFRKQLAAGRLYFIAELQKARPAIRDEWHPWLLAFELGPEMDDWSATGTLRDHQTSTTQTSSTSRSSSPSPGAPSWSGFGGGRSGGAGGGATWAAAAGGLAAGVAAPSSSSSGSGGGSSSSSGGGSSGGGGGGGW